MSNPLLITSAQNPKIKEASQLRAKRHRDETGLFLIEGFRELTCAVEAGVAIEMFFFSPQHFLGVNERNLIEAARLNGAALYEVSAPLFDKLSYRDRGDGLLATARQTHRGLGELAKIKKEASAPFFLVAEAIEKPGNLGSILRSADAAGVDALILCDPCTDIYNPNVVRASVGTLFSVPVIEEKTGAVIEQLAAWKIPLVASTPQAALSFTEANLAGPLCIAVGTEQLGLSEKWLEMANVQVKIPMHGQCNSLNVAAATTLLLYEAVRQRNMGG